MQLLPAGVDCARQRRGILFLSQSETQKNLHMRSASKSRLPFQEGTGHYLSHEVADDTPVINEHAGAVCIEDTRNANLRGKGFRRVGNALVRVVQPLGYYEGLRTRKTS